MEKNTRKETILDLISKYKRQVDDIFIWTMKPIPDFADISNEDGEVVQTSEQRVYSFINARKNALNLADEILLKIQDLECELYDPNWQPKQKEEDEPKAEPKLSRAKRIAQNG